MSVTTYRNNIDRINIQIADLLKKQVAEKKKEVDISSKINDISKKINSTKSISTIQSLQKQIETKSKELVKAQGNIAKYEKNLADKRKELSKNQESLTRALEIETKKRQDKEIRFLKDKEKINRSEINNIRNYNNELRLQQSIFEDYKFSGDKIEITNDEFSLNELFELNKRIDNVLETLEKLGYGQEIIFNEIEELKSKSKKISKKDLSLILIGQLVSYGSGIINNELTADIFQKITNISLTKLIK